MRTVTNAETAAEEVKAGRYRLKYFGGTIGDESFRVERLTDGGFRIEANLTKAPQDQPAARSVYLLDAEHRFVSGTYEPLEGGGPSATYTVEDGTLFARSSTGLEQRVELGDGDLIAGPHYMTDFWILAPLDLDEGERTHRIIHSFGFKDWTITPCSVVIERVEDTRIDGERVRVIKCRIDNGSEVFNTSSYIPEDGFSVKISIGAPIGTANARLTKADGAE